ncbi:MAG: PorP/SprF family type IX secretion system membrane protein [Saprospiraceae bacterium]|nr:PorP/SprF family type IX secretion system membrane protein [Saprospiraceae bacterium]
MKKSLLIILLATAFIAKVSAQDEAIFGHYLVNPILINPAYSGMTGKYQIFGHLRNQWTGFPGQPKTYAVSLNAPLAQNVGMGGMLLNEKFGLLDRMRAQLSYAYHYDNAKKGFKAGFGFSTEVHRTRLDASITTDPFFESGDRIIEANMKNVSFFDATAGGYAVINDKINLSLALPNLIRARLGVISNDSTTKEKTFLRQFIFSGGYKIKMEKMTFEPSLVARKVYQAPFEVDLNMVGRFFDDKLFLGVSMRPGNSGNMGLMVGTKQDFFQVYYSYNSSLAEVKTYNRQAHEVTLGVEFARKQQTQSPTEKKKKRYKN